jgi:carbon-monoxide dehydrogenase small subunit
VGEREGVPVRLAFTLNGDPVEVEVPGGRTLLWVLRDVLGLTGTKWGCRVGDCGACTVLLDGAPALACLLAAGQVEGRGVTTIEGLERRGTLADLQEAFVGAGAIQCGYCTPGMILAAWALLERDPDPDEAAVRRALAGNLCRCTGYGKIVDAVLATARARRAG